MTADIPETIKHGQKDDAEEKMYVATVPDKIGRASCRERVLRLV